MDNHKEFKTKWDLNKRENDFIDYCYKNNYEILEIKQFISKTKFIVSIQTGIIEKFDIENIPNKLDTKIYDRSILNRLQLEKMKELVKEDNKNANYD